MSAKCSVPSCKDDGAVRLQGHGYPDSAKTDTYWFCTRHAPIYQQRGYRGMGEKEQAGQLGMEAA